MDCLFCKIIKREIPSDCIYEDDLVFAFRDIDPQAPKHFLVIPKKHIESVNDLMEEDEEHLLRIFLTIKKLAKEEGLEKGYRVVTNIGQEGGQSVNHLHFHVLGGRSLQWPPG